MEHNERLENYREQIDTLDKELLYLFKRRFEIVFEVGKLKKEHGIKPLQEDRWQKLLAENIEAGKRLGLSEEFIRDIWERVHKEALEIEK